MYGFLFCTRGLGSILSMPISTALVLVLSLSVTDGGGARRGFALDDGRFAPLIGYIGACFAATTLTSIAGWYWNKVEDSRPLSI